MRKNSFELSIIKELQRNGHYISMISTDINPYSGKTRDKDKQKYTNQNTPTKITDEPVNIDGIPVFTLHSILSSSLGTYCPDASSLAKKIIRNYDVIHIASWYHYPAIVFSKTASEHRVPYVFAAYATLQPENRGHKRLQKWFLDNIYTKKMIRKASGFQAVGDLEARAYVKLGADPKKIYRIDPAIAPETFEIKKRTDIFKKIGINTRDQYLLCLGRMVERKRIELIIYAFTKLLENKKDLILIIAGAGTKSYEQKIKQLIHDLKIENNVKFSGIVLGDEKLELLESAKIFVHAASGDIHPLAVEEALTMGIPVVTTDCDMPEIEEYKAGIVVEPNLDSMYQALIKLLEDNDKLVAFSKNAKRLSIEKYMVRDQVKKYEIMYENAIRNNSINVSD